MEMRYTQYLLGDIFKLSAGGDLDKTTYSPFRTSKYCFPIYSNSIDDRGLYGFTTKYNYKGDSITITGRGNVGHAEYRSENFDAIIRLLVLEPNADSIIDSKFVAEYINQCVQFPLESTGVPQLTVPQIKNIRIEVPEYEEQKKISNAISDIDKLISALKKQIQKKKLIKQGVMQELLSGKRRLKGFSKEWKSFNLMSGSKIKARIGWQGLKKTEYLDSGYAFLVTGTDFVDGRVKWDTCHFVERERYNQDENIQIKNGDILVTKDGTLGKTAFVQGLTRPATLNCGVFVIRPLQNAYDPEFVYHILSSFVFKEFLDKLSAGSTIVHLYQKDMSKFEFLLPPTLDEQKAIAAILSEMDEEIEKLEEKYEKYTAIKQGMMEQLLTGKIRLV